MNLYFVFVISCVWRTDAKAVADIFSNYSKVAVNVGKLHEGRISSASPTSTSKSTPAIEAPSGEEHDDDTPEYGDFDDLAETTERNQSSFVDTQSMLKYFNGFVNLLALMYKFTGNPKTTRPGSLHFSKSRPRHGGMDLLANSINQMAQDRFHPTTATKKFQNQQGYPPVDTYSPYPSPPAETYKLNGGKTSYDADATQYMIKNPNAVVSSESLSNDMTAKPSEEMTKTKNFMQEYMSQNEPVDIQQSYSYEIPQPSQKMKINSVMGIHDDGIKPWKPPVPEPEPENGPLYYPWMAKPTMKQPPHGEESEEDEHPVGPVYYPWKNPPKKMKLKPPPLEEENGGNDASQPWDLKPPPKNNKSPKDTPPVDNDALYYPWSSYGPPKKLKPIALSPMTDEDDAPEDEDVSSWGMKPPGKSKPPKTDMGPPPDDHSYPYPYFSGHDHGVVYHDDHHEELEDDMKDMKDEDRESKRPYTYYHLGRKLWYVPLLFSLYFIVYIASLILKSIARHKVELPEKLWELNDHNDHHHHHHGDEHSRRSRKIEEVTDNVYMHLDKAQNKFM